uniref:Uncharacterized protein n=1 Tax=Lepeophtheirus salmonis TaxID=72036 RepID=A0A0K2V4Z6_LEPSM
MEKVSICRRESHPSMETGRTNGMGSEEGSRSFRDPEMRSPPPDIVVRFTSSTQNSLSRRMESNSGKSPGATKVRTTSDSSDCISWAKLMGVESLVGGDETT